MRIVFVGSPPFAERPLEALWGSAFRPCGLVTAPPRRGGRGRKEVANPLVEVVAQENVPVLRPDRAKDPDFLKEFAALQPDLAIVVAYGQILNQQFLNTPQFGCINLHASVLPRWRGASPIQAALWKGDAKSGVSIQKVVPELDAGAVLAQKELSIPARCTAPQLASELSDIGAELLIRFLSEVGDGPLPAGIEQDFHQVTHCRRMRREDGYMNWAEPALQVDRFVRAVSGWPWAQTHFEDGVSLRVGSGFADPERSHDLQPGTVLETVAGFWVACGSGAYCIERIQRPGKAMLSAAEFLRGSKVKPGDRLHSLTNEEPNFVRERSSA